MQPVKGQDMAKDLADHDGRRVQQVVVFLLSTSCCFFIMSVAKKTGHTNQTYV
jgi:hypothetical protein